MQSAATCVGLTVKFPTRVQRGEYRFEGRLFRFGMRIDRDPSAVVFDRTGRPIFVQRYDDFRTVACQVFIDAVVDNFP